MKKVKLASLAFSSFLSLPGQALEEPGDRDHLPLSELYKAITKTDAGGKETPPLEGRQTDILETLGKRVEDLKVLHGRIEKYFAPSLRKGTKMEREISTAICNAICDFIERKVDKAGSRRDAAQARLGEDASITSPFVPKDTEDAIGRHAFLIKGIDNLSRRLGELELEIKEILTNKTIAGEMIKKKKSEIEDWKKEEQDAAESQKTLDTERMAVRQLLSTLEGKIRMEEDKLPNGDTSSLKNAAAITASLQLLRDQRSEANEQYQALERDLKAKRAEAANRQVEIEALDKEIVQLQGVIEDQGSKEAALLELGREVDKQKKALQSQADQYALLKYLAYLDIYSALPNDDNGSNGHAKERRGRLSAVDSPTLSLVHRRARSSSGSLLTSGDSLLGSSSVPPTEGQLPSASDTLGSALKKEEYEDLRPDRQIKRRLLKWQNKLIEGSRQGGKLTGRLEDSGEAQPAQPASLLENLGITYAFLNPDFLLHRHAPHILPFHKLQARIRQVESDCLRARAGQLQKDAVRMEAKGDQERAKELQGESRQLEEEATQRLKRDLGLESIKPQDQRVRADWETALDQIMLGAFSGVLKNHKGIAPRIEPIYDFLQWKASFPGKSRNVSNFEQRFNNGQLPAQRIEEEVRRAYWKYISYTIMSYTLCCDEEGKWRPLHLAPRFIAKPESSVDIILMKKAWKWGNRVRTYGKNFIEAHALGALTFAPSPSEVSKEK